eukprot:scaffold52601_cov32-Tisochrysis_lutea.AAC.2
MGLIALEKPVHLGGGLLPRALGMAVRALGSALCGRRRVRPQVARLGRLRPSEGTACAGKKLLQVRLEERQIAVRSLDYT